MITIENPVRLKKEPDEWNYDGNLEIGDYYYQGSCGPAFINPKQVIYIRELIMNDDIMENNDFVEAVGFENSDNLQKWNEEDEHPILFQIKLTNGESIYTFNKNAVKSIKELI